MALNFHIDGNKITFNRAIVAKAFFALASEMGYSVHVTGGNFLTHEIECTEDEFKTLQAMSKDAGYVPPEIERKFPVADTAGFATREEAEEWMRREVDDGCMDNFRFAFYTYDHYGKDASLTDEEFAEYQKYFEIRDDGCCGFFDKEITVAGRRAIIGCNFGH